MSVWTDAELADLQRDYDSDHGGHDDVVALIRGARAVVALHAPIDRNGLAHCSHCIDTWDWEYPCATIRALSLEGSP